MSGPPAASPLSSDDARLVGRLRDGTSGFEELVTASIPAMLAVARGYVRDRRSRRRSCRKRGSAVLNGLDRFEGRSSLRTWVLRIVANIAHDRGVREARSYRSRRSSAPRDEPAVEPERFRGADEPFPGGWRSFPTDWRTLPESRLLSRETLDHVASGDRVAARRRSGIVITLRDVTGCERREVCEALGISDGNQRVLLHRARARVRARAREVPRWLSAEANASSYTCQEVVELATDYLEGAMTRAQMTAFELHLNFCDGCVSFVDQVRTTPTMARGLSEEQIPEEMQGQAALRVQRLEAA